MGEDEADSCAVYLAEFLRSFGTCGIDGLLLVETAASDPADATQLGWYQPVINIALHYRWDLGLRLPESTRFSGGAESLQFLIAPWEIDGTTYGYILPAAIWSDVAPEVPLSAKLVFAAVPSDAVPEQVLSRLEQIRAR